MCSESVVPRMALRETGDKDVSRGSLTAAYLDSVPLCAKR